MYLGQRSWKSFLANGVNYIVLLLYAIIFVLINLIIDLTYSWIDPRIRYQ